MFTLTPFGRDPYLVTTRVSCITALNLGSVNFWFTEIQAKNSICLRALLAADNFFKNMRIIKKKRKKKRKKKHPVT